MTRGTQAVVCLANQPLRHASFERKIMLLRWKKNF